MMYSEQNTTPTTTNPFVYYDVNCDEINQEGRHEDIWRDNPFSISHPEPHARPSIALNFTHEQISELRGVCFSESFSIPQKDISDTSSWTSKLLKHCAIQKNHPFCWAKHFANLTLLIGWLLFIGFFFFENTQQSEGSNHKNAWIILIAIFILLLLVTICSKKMFSNYKTNDKSLQCACYQLIPCLKGVKDEEKAMLYSVRT